MNIKSYLDEDLELIDGLAKELNDNLATWDSDETLKKASVMFDALHRRFALENLLLRHVQPTAEMKVAVKEFLKIRRTFQEDLESLLTLQIGEPNFRKEISNVLEHVFKHLSFIKTNFDQDFLDQITSTKIASLSADLESKVGSQAFA